MNTISMLKELDNETNKIEWYRNSDPKYSPIKVSFKKDGMILPY